MTLLVVGISHHSAPVAVLDELALTTERADALLADIARSDAVAEGMVLATCNRLEIYADVPRFHPALEAITELIARQTGSPRAELTNHLFVHYDEGAITHLFDVAAGLDSMVVGEQQILGQVRSALKAAQENGTAGRVLNELGQAALRCGKQVHTDTAIDRAGASVVSVAIDEAREVLGGLAGRTALVIGAGAMSSLAVARLSEENLASLVIANRSSEAANRLAEGSKGRPVALADLAAEVAAADLIVSCTGAQGIVLSYQDVASARESARPLVVLDLALPHDTAPEIASIPGVTRIDLAGLAALPNAQASAEDVAQARRLVAEHVARATTGQAIARVEPIVVSLRARAAEVAEAELLRLRNKMPDLPEELFGEVERAVRRVTATLLHTPTVRMKEFASNPEGHRYAEALHTLFDLDPAAVESLTKRGGEQQ